MRVTRNFPKCDVPFQADSVDIMAVPCDDLTQMVYESDGNDNPVTEIARLMHSNEPQLRQFIQDKLLRPVPVSGKPASSLELAEEFAQKPGEPDDIYVSRLNDAYREFVESSIPESDE